MIIGGENGFLSDIETEPFVSGFKRHVPVRIAEYSGNLRLVSGE